MRLFVVLAFVAALAVDADAARKPTTREKAAVTVAVATQTPDDLFILRRVVVSTVQPGSRSPYSRFAAAFGFARDQAALVALHRRYRSWAVVDYGSRRIGCHMSQIVFGGRRAAVLRDLGIRCG
jgi:hypothetical protein